MDTNTEISTLPDYKSSAVLFVDDEEKSLKYFSRVFSNNFRIITAVSVEFAVNILEQRADEIAILITDQRMPRQKGVDLLKYCREKHPHIVRLLTTAYTDLDDAIAAVNTGEIFRYITKPWDIVKLNDFMTDAMNLYLAREQERNLLEGKRQAMFQLAGNIAHELRTPLLSILAAAKGSGNYLPRLVAAYAESLPRETEPEPIREIHLETLKDSLSDIITESNHALTIIDMLLINIRGVEINPESFDLLSMRECIEEARRRYPFRDNQAKLINISGDEDFSFRGIRLLMIHVIFNLIKNSLYAIASNGNNGSITVTIQPGTDRHRVYFKDTGAGISAAVMPHIFDSFYSTHGDRTEGSIGFGLSFCKSVLWHFKASIKCMSETGHYTEFVLDFPAASSV